ncbi:MAG: hypothetical protein FD122_3751, partial [Stygiobacter sp.]
METATALNVRTQDVDGMVDMMMDATQNCFSPLTFDRLF